MAEADDDFFVGDAAAYVGLGLIGSCVAGLNFERDFVGAAVLGTFERTNSAGDGRVHVGSRSGDDARCKRGSVELMLGVKNQRSLHGRGPQRAGCFAMQQVKKMRGDGIGF